MGHPREFKEEVEIVEEKSPDEVRKSALSDPSPRYRGGGKVMQMWGATSASLGAMRPLVAKLDKLLLDPPQWCSSKKVKDKMHLLKEDIKEISSCLDKLSKLEDPPPTSKCWMNEAREMSYKMEDYIDSLLFVHPTDPSVVADDIKTTKSPRKWYYHVKCPKEHKQIAATVSEFRKYAQRVIQRRKVYVLSDSKIENTLSHRVVSVSQVLPMPYEETAVVVIDRRMNEFINSFAKDGDKQLKVVSVLGSACLGKTTLARVLFDKIGMQFDCRAFIRVSKKPDMNRIFNDMLSQLQQQDHPQYLAEVDLIDKIKSHILDKRYLIIVDDVWAASVWDIINHALPKGSHGSRIITTTQIEDVALTCCHYQSERVFKMKPLDYHHSRKLFFNRLFGSESDCPEELKNISNKIVEICAGLPLATLSMASLLASQPVKSVDLLMYTHKSLSSCLSTNPASERTRKVLNLSFNNLPQYLKTCLMYLIMYPEGHTFLKDNLVKQYVAEGFIDATKGQDMENAAESYLHQLIGRRFIQPIRVNFNNEVLSFAVHEVVHDLIAHKSAEENFIVPIDYNCRKNVSLYHKARRLSLLFDDARYAKTPASIIKSQVRSLTFFGLFESMPSTTEFKFVCVLNLQISGYGGRKGLGHDDNPVDLSMISELSRLRYLKIASHVCIKLPDYMGGPHCLETLDIMDAMVHKFGIIARLPYLLHLYLSLRDERNVQNWIKEMSDLDKLKHLQDLRLNFSSARSLSQEENMVVLQDFISGHDNLRTMVVTCDSSYNVTYGASDAIISWDDMATPPLLQKFEFSPHSGVTFSQIPKWVGKLGNLCILKISVRILEMDSVDILRGLHTLTALSLYVWRETSKMIIFRKAAGFSVLRYFKMRFTTGISCIKFEENAMPNLLKLKLVFSVIPGIDQHEHGIISIDHMPSLREMSVKFGSVAPDSEYDLVSNHLSNPTINKKLAVYSSYDEESTNLKQHTYEILEEERDEILEEERDGYGKELKSQDDQSISRSPESSSRPHVPVKFSDSAHDTPLTDGTSVKLEDFDDDPQGNNYQFDFDLQEIGELLPDEYDIFAGITNEIEPTGQANSAEELEEFDLFGIREGMELDTDPLDGITAGLGNASIGDGLRANEVNSNFGLSNSPGAMAREHPLGEHPSRTLFVRNINNNVDDSELRSLFEQFGDIETLYTARKHRGFVMISYFDIRAACGAKRSLQNKPLRRRKLDVHFSIPKENPSDKDLNQGILLIFNLEPSVSNEEVRRIFGAYGEVKEIRETPNKKHDKCIEFYDVRAAEAALQSLNKSEIAGKRIKLELGLPGGKCRSLLQYLGLELEEDEPRGYRHPQVGSPMASSPPGAWSQYGSPTDNNFLHVFKNSPAGHGMGPIGMPPSMMSNDVKIAPIEKESNWSKYDQVFSNRNQSLGAAFQHSQSYRDLNSLSLQLARDWKSGTITEWGMHPHASRGWRSC